MERTDDSQIDDALRLARDLCVALASFFAAADGPIVVSITGEGPGGGTAARVRELASLCLTHPLARDRQFFANAELNREGLSDDESLACIAVPVWSGERWLGVIGVVDTWLPELDDEQRFGLERIGNILARRMALPAAGSPAASRPEPPRPEPEPEPEQRPFGLDRRQRPRREPPRQEQPRQEPLRSEQPWDAEPAPVDHRQGHPSLEASPLAQARTAGAGQSWSLSSRLILEQVDGELPEALLVCLVDGPILYANDVFSDLAELAPEAIIGHDVAALFSIDDPALLAGADEAHLTELLVGAPSPGRRLLLSTPTGERRPVDVAGRRVQLAALGPCFSIIVHPAQELERLEHAALGERALEAAFDSLEEGIVVCDQAGSMHFINKAARAMQGLAEDEILIGHLFPATTGLLASDAQPLTREQHPLSRALRGTVVRGEHLLVGEGEEEEGRRHLLASAQPLEVDGGRGAILVLRDVTSQTIEQARLTHLALHDPLTGLANRNLLLDHLQRIMSETRSRGGLAAIIFLDLDGFKEVNDVYGHDVGDEVLVAFSRRLQGAVRTSDVVARLGGDEFVIAHTSPGDEGELYQVVDRIRKTLSVPYQVRGHALVITCSIGWVVADPSMEDPLDLLVSADHEMYRAKRGRETGEMT